MSVQNFNSADPFAVDKSEQEGLIHIRIQQRNGRKTLTTVQGISEKYDKKRLVKYFKKNFSCNGTVVDHPEHGEVIQLQGDQRQSIHDFLIEIDLATKNQEIFATGDFFVTRGKSEEMFTAWSPVQIARLNIERELLEKYFPERVTWISPRCETKVEIKLETNQGHSYTLRTDLAEDFPNSCPRLSIVAPKNLKQKNGLKLPENSSEFHTLRRVDGCIGICHFYPLHWNAQNTLYQVFMKGRLWLEAYEAHLNTGKPINVYLPEQVDALVPLIDLLVMSNLRRNSSE